MFAYLAALVLIYLASLVHDWKKHRKPAHLSEFKDVPVVEGCFPVVGHGPAFGKDIIKYIQKCQKKYGNIFRLKIFKIDMVIVCDRALVPEFFKATENRMSLYDVLDRLYFSDAFSDNPETLPTIITLVSKN
jgi:hypothetical protein